MPGTERPAGEGHRTDSRKRQALVGVRLSPDELATLKAVAAREGRSLPSALRESFLRQAASDLR